MNVQQQKRMDVEYIQIDASTFYIPYIMYRVLYYMIDVNKAVTNVDSSWNGVREYIGEHTVKQ